MANPAEYIEKQVEQGFDWLLKSIAVYVGESKKRRARKAPSK